MDPDVWEQNGDDPLTYALQHTWFVEEFLLVVAYPKNGRGQASFLVPSTWAVRRGDDGVPRLYNVSSLFTATEALDGRSVVVSAAEVDELLKGAPDELDGAVNNGTFVGRPVHKGRPRKTGDDQQFLVGLRHFSPAAKLYCMPAGFPRNVGALAARSGEAIPLTALATRVARHATQMRAVAQEVAQRVAKEGGSAYRAEVAAVAAIVETDMRWRSVAAGEQEAASETLLSLAWHAFADFPAPAQERLLRLLQQGAPDVTRFMAAPWTWSDLAACVADETRAVVASMLDTPCAKALLGQWHLAQDDAVTVACAIHHMRAHTPDTSTAHIAGALGYVWKGPPLQPPAGEGWATTMAEWAPSLVQETFTILTCYSKRVGYRQPFDQHPLAVHRKRLHPGDEAPHQRGVAHHHPPPLGPPLPAGVFAPPPSGLPPPPPVDAPLFPGLDVFPPPPGSAGAPQTPNPPAMQPAPPPPPMQRSTALTATSKGGFHDDVLMGATPSASFFWEFPSMVAEDGESEAFSHPWTFTQ